MINDKNNNNEENKVNKDKEENKVNKDKEENNSKIPERLSGVALEQANKAVAPHSMGD